MSLQRSAQNRPQGTQNRSQASHPTQGPQNHSPYRSISNNPIPLVNPANNVNNSRIDSIDLLPVDESIPSQSEIQIMDVLFKKQLTIFEKILLESKDVLLAGFLFMIFSTPQADALLVKLIPYTQTSPYIHLICKALCFMFLYFFIRNLHLVRR